VSSTRAERIEEIRRSALEAIHQASSASELEQLRIRVLGRSGELTVQSQALGTLPTDERKLVGQKYNEAKREVEALLASRLAARAEDERRARRAGERLDLTLPGRRPPLGALHPLTRVEGEIVSIFVGLGFSVAEGPEIETDYFNFEALNIPRDHPARDMQDTFYLADVLLRTHTSPVQIRTMKAQRPPVRIICPGRVYRRDADITHSPVFHQVEGLAVDRDISMGDLKGTLELFAREMFGAGSAIRFRPSFFPFTEPSAEVDVRCFLCQGVGCRVCKQSGWLEILGSGMVHPQVLKNVGYDPEEVTGWAFGMGVERVAMLKYGIDDIRLFFENDLRFLRQFA
jgi:phenylalanyl-tRNA synthetase alpha chain